MKQKYGIDNIYRAMILVCDWINIDENVHVNGIQVFIDLSNMTMKHHLHLMNFDNMKKMFQYYQVCFVIVGGGGGGVGALWFIE